MPSRAFTFFRSLLFFASGAFVLAADLLYVPYNAWWIAHSADADALVVATPFGPFHPRVRYVTSDGVEVAAALHGVVWGLEGDELPVRYDPERPRVAVVDTFLGRWGEVLFVGGMGLGFVVVSVVSLRGAGRRIRDDRRRHSEPAL